MSPRPSQREEAVNTVREHLRPGEQIVAVLPFASTPKRPKGPEGKVRYGVYTSYRRYRPLVATDRRLFVLDTSRTPHPRGILAEFPIGDVAFVDVVPSRLSQRLQLELPGLGTVPFVLGRYDMAELPDLRAALEP